MITAGTVPISDYTKVYEYLSDASQPHVCELICYVESHAPHHVNRDAVTVCVMRYATGKQSRL